MDRVDESFTDLNLAEKRVSLGKENPRLFKLSIDNDTHQFTGVINALIVWQG